MTGSYRQIYVKCPFYHKDIPSRRQIICEGIEGEGNGSLALNLSNKESYDKQLTAFCCDQYCHCQIYRMLMLNYPD